MWNNVRALLILAGISLGIAHATDAPEDVQAVFSRAAELVNSEQYTEALPLLKDLASQLPQSPEPAAAEPGSLLESGSRRGTVER